MPNEASGPTRSLASLAARAQLGDRGALEELLRRLQAPLRDHIRGLVRDHDLAEDVLQESLILLCRRLGTVRQTEWIRAWAYRVATRAAFRALRRSRRNHAEPLEELSAMADTTHDESEIDTEKLLSELPTTIARLPSAAQVVVRLHYLQSLTQQEIAEVLDIPIGTVKSRLAYGLTFLRKVWLATEPPSS